MNNRVFLKNEKEIPYLDLFLHERIKSNTIVLVIPGGGYFFCNPREGEDIAYAFLAKGFDAAVLQYSTNKGDLYPKQLIETASAIDYLKK